MVSRNTCLSFGRFSNTAIVSVFTAGGKVLEMPAAVPRPGDLVAEILRSGAQAFLAQALAAEIAAQLATCEPLKDDQGRQRSAAVLLR